LIQVKNRIKIGSRFDREPRPAGYDDRQWDGIKGRSKQRASFSRLHKFDLGHFFPGNKFYAGTSLSGDGNGCEKREEPQARRVNLNRQKEKPLWSSRTTIKRWA
jgi:hypothetical protein